MISYTYGDVLKLRTPKAFIAHACNAQGVAGAGIAGQISKKYPIDTGYYETWCFKTAPFGGDFLHTAPNNILWLITSDSFGYYKDTEEEILKNTELVIQSLNDYLPKNSKVYSNKFNSGLFNVPWIKTENVLLNTLRSDINWIVVDYIK